MPAALPQPSSSGRTQLLSIDLLRGSAALAVLLYHSQAFFTRNPQLGFFGSELHQLFEVAPLGSSIATLLFGLGFLGVPLFFVISGFCIHLPFAASDKALVAGVFARRRFFRLYPAYLVACVLGFAVAAATGGLGQEPVTVANAIGHLFFWHYSWPLQNQGAEATVVIWSIVVEVHFYLLYALLLPALRRFGFSRAALVGLGLGLAYRMLWDLQVQPGDDVLRFFNPNRFAPARFGEWLLGAALAERYAARGAAMLDGWGSWWQWVLGGFAVLVVSVAWLALSGGSVNSLAAPATVGFALFAGGLVAREAQGRLQAGSVVRALGKWLGDRSYSLYLVHYVVLAVVGEMAAIALGIPDKQAAGGSLLWFGVTLAGFGAAGWAADVMYRLVEAPSHGLARRLGRDALAPRPGRYALAPRLDR